MRTFLLVLACSCVLLSACETTGDPRQGGLFGWSERKAQQRQVDMKARAAAAERQNKDEQQLRKSNAEQKESAQVAVRAAELRINALLDENAKLERQLAALRMRNTTLSATLQSLLDELDATRSQVDAAGRVDESPEERQRHADRLDDRNRRLQEAILMFSQG